MRVGYARVSTDDQTLDLQRDALKRAKCREVYEEQASVKNAARPQLEACLKALREGDTLIVWRLDRLGRSLGDLIHLTHELKARAVGFASLTEQIDTQSPSGQLVFHVFGALTITSTQELSRARAVLMVYIWTPTSMLSSDRHWPALSPRSSMDELRKAGLTYFIFPIVK